MDQSEQHNSDKSEILKRITVEPGKKAKMARKRSDFSDRFLAELLMGVPCCAKASDVLGLGSRAAQANEF